MGPGSPTYAVRQLQQSRIWETLRACQRQGAAVVFSSAATLAASRWTLPVYEIYKAGSDLYWHEGLDFFGAYGLALILVSHWNNSDGGAVLDTSRCYLGEQRFQALLDLVPGGMERYTIVGIDENTALAIDPAQEMCTVVGTGAVTILRAGVATVCAAGEQFAAKELGDFHLPAGTGRHRRRACGRPCSRAGRMAQRAVRPLPQPDAEVQALLSAREQARAARNWQESDRLRDEIERLGWRVQDTGSGQRVEPAR